jgi:hypothetical protein
MDRKKRIDLADAIEGKALDGPLAIKMTLGPPSLDTELWLPEILTVAQWREAQQIAIDGDDELPQFRMATLVLAMAERNDLPEDAVALPSLGFPQAVEDVAASQHYLQGADGIWRRREQLLQ